jgi:hypothetical protein
MPELIITLRVRTDDPTDSTERVLRRRYETPYERFVTGWDGQREYQGALVACEIQREASECPKS